MTELLLLCARREDDLQLIAARRALLAASKRCDAGTEFSSEMTRTASESIEAAGATGSKCDMCAEGTLWTT